MKKRTPEQWQSLFDAHQRSGLSANAFCKANKLCAKYFSLRRRQLQPSQNKTVTPKESTFVRAMTPTSLPSDCSRRILWQSPYGELSFPLSVPHDWLASVIKSLT